MTSPLLPTISSRERGNPAWLRGHLNDSSRQRVTRYLTIGAITAIIFYGVFLLSDSVAPANSFSEYSKSVTDYYNKVLPSKQNGKRNYAYATFLNTASNRKNESSAWIDDPEEERDGYYMMTRMLNYQLRYHPKIRSTNGYPLVVMHTPNVEDWKVKQLQEDGAVTRAIDSIPFSDWMPQPTRTRWAGMFAKLQVFTLTDYDRVLFLDADMILTKPLDDIFDDEDVTEVPTKVELMLNDEGEIPKSYIFTGGVESGKDHKWPRTTPYSSFGAGFFLTRPDKILYDHMMTIYSIPGRFDTSYVEQNLMNHVFRQDGPMPAHFFKPGKWYTNYVSAVDLLWNIPALHMKYWVRKHDTAVTELAFRRLGQMQGHFKEYA